MENENRAIELLKMCIKVADSGESDIRGIPLREIEIFLDGVLPKKENKTLWLDVDGVLLEWVKPFLIYVKSPAPYEDLKEYDLSFLFGGNVEKMVEAINAFNRTLKYTCLDPLVTREELQRLKDKGYTLNIISQVDGATARAFRVKNLEDAFGEGMFDQFVLVGRGTSKAKWLQENSPEEFITVVEDNPKFFEEAVKLNEERFNLLPIIHPYNAKEIKELGFLGWDSLSDFLKCLC